MFRKYPCAGQDTAGIIAVMSFGIISVSLQMQVEQ
jgi:hypothetical protein